METNTKPLGALLPGIVETTIDGTASLAPSTTALASINLATLPARLDDGMMATLRDIVNSPLPAAQTCEEKHFGACMKSLDILPRRADDTGGMLRFNLYQRKLGGYSNEAMSYLVSRALEQCHWFPTIAECLSILAGFPNREVATDRRDTAKVLIRREANARMDDDLGLLKNRRMAQEQIDALPEFTKRVATERCTLWACKDGTHIARQFAPLDDETRAEIEKRGGLAA